MRHVGDKRCKENGAVYEIMWECVVESNRSQMTIWRKRVASWVTKATNLHSEYVILIEFAVQQWLHESAPQPYLIRT